MSTNVPDNHYLHTEDVRGWRIMLFRHDIIDTWEVSTYDIGPSQVERLFYFHQLDDAWVCFLRVLRLLVYQDYTGLEEVTHDYNRHAVFEHGADDG